MQRIVFPALFMSVRIHSFTPQTQAYYCTHWTIHVDLKMKKVYVCQVEGKKKQQSKGKIIWYSVTLKQSVQLETKGNWSECNSLKGRSELETETIIWYFSGTWLCCIVLLNSWRYALNPECCSFSHPCCTSSQTHTHTLSQSPFSREKKKMVPIVHFTTGNVEVKCSVDHSDIYGSRFTFKCKLIFTIGNLRGNDTYFKNPKGRGNRAKK